jgi:hypothetical protein
MPKGLQGQKRPADVIGNAVHIMRPPGSLRRSACRQLWPQGFPIT